MGKNIQEDLRAQRRSAERRRAQYVVRDLRERAHAAMIAGDRLRDRVDSASMGLDTLTLSREELRTLATELRGMGYLVSRLSAKRLEELAA